MALIPDPRGLWVQAFIGMILLNDNYFYAWFIFALIHYTIVWETSAANQMPPLMMWEFLVRMAYVYAWGTFAGIAIAVAMRTRAQIPGHTMRRGWPRLGLFLATLNIISGIKLVFTLTGARRVHEDFGPDPALLETQIPVWILLIANIASFIAVMVLTYMNRRTADFWSWLAITYRDNYHNYLIIDYIVAMILILSPQAIWDFLVLPPTSWTQIEAGVLTLAVEIGVWVAIFYWFTLFRQINKTHFAREHSLVWFGEYVLIVGGLHVLSGIVYIIGAEFLNTMEDAERLLGGMLVFTILVAIALFLLLSKRRLIETGKSGKSKKKKSGEEEDNLLLGPRSRQLSLGLGGH